MVLVVGSPGIGKTRLVAELAASVSLDGGRISYTSLRDAGEHTSLLEPMDPEQLDLLILDHLEERPGALDTMAERRARLGGTRWPATSSISR